MNQLPSPKPWLPYLLWTMFTFILLITLYLSFQSGPATKALEKPLVTQVTGTLKNTPTQEQILTITYYLRQAGRAILFFALGFTGSWAIILTFRKVTTKIRILSSIHAVRHSLFYRIYEALYRRKTLFLPPMPGRLFLRHAGISVYRYDTVPDCTS